MSSWHLGMRVSDRGGGEGWSGLSGTPSSAGSSALFFATSHKRFDGGVFGLRGFRETQGADVISHFLISITQEAKTWTRLRGLLREDEETTS